MLINPETLLKRLLKAEKQAERLILKGLKSQKLERINQDNLLQGKDSEGSDMPFYSNSEYGFEKTMRNPRNRGKWDLKNTGAYHSGIYTIIQKKTILFKQRLRNKKVNWIDLMLEKANRNPLGITKEQLIEAQKKNIDIVKPDLLKIINGS
jgi:hypothetical protein